MRPAVAILAVSTVPHSYKPRELLFYSRKRGGNEPYFAFNLNEGKMANRSASIVVRGTVEGNRVNWSIKRAKQQGLAGSYWIKWRQPYVGSSLKYLTDPSVRRLLNHVQRPAPSGPTSMSPERWQNQ